MSTCVISSFYFFQIIDDVRRDYKRSAADRGTMYCTCGGVVIVATIVLLLIIFA